MHKKKEALEKSTNDHIIRGTTQCKQYISICLCAQSIRLTFIMAE